MPRDDKTTDAAGLRTGFSTGAYAAATALTAWRCLRGDTWREQIPLWFADGQIRIININGAKLHKEGAAEAWAVKDGGDDIDVTDKAVIKSRVSHLDNSQPHAEDFIEHCGKAILVIRGATGVGLVRRPGLDVPVGKWAINPVPRAMIVENLLDSGAGDNPARILVEVAIENGEKLAHHTLNPVLGIERGLSVLGTTGLVIPCSNAAYLGTIRALIRGAAATRTERIALVTGSRTHGWLRGIHPNLPEYACVRIGDFIREALEICQKESIHKVYVGCMGGKLAKYALGHPHTHAHRVNQDVREILRLLHRQGFSPEGNRGKTFRSFRETLDIWSPKEQQRAISILSRAAVAVFKQWAPKVKVEILAFNPRGRLFSESAEP